MPKKPAAKKTTTKKTAKASTVDFQKEFTKLEKITDDFESGNYDLEAGLKKFEEGLQIAQALQSHLEGVENRIEEIKSQYGKNDESTSEAN